MAFSPLVPTSFTETQVAIALSSSPLGGGHLGLAYHSEQGPSLLHLGWHKALYLNKLPDELRGCWVSVTLDLPALVSKQVVAYIRAMEYNQPEIKYGTDFIASEKSFSPIGEYTPPTGSHGLTCASFVLEVLRGASIDLIRSETWQASEENIIWANEVCTLLEQNGADKNHVDAVKNSIKGLRLQPYELAGSATLLRNAWPANFETAQPVANTAKIELANFCPVCPV